MDLLLVIVEAQAAAKALVKAGAHSLHAVEDCASLAEILSKVLPAALSVLEGAAATSEDVRTQAVACVQGLTAALVQLQGFLTKLNEHESEGVLSILLEHPTTWLHVYRGFRAVTAQLTTLSSLVRSAAQRRRAEGADAALDAAVKALMAICARSRDAANLLGSELPEFARCAAAASWAPDRVRVVVQSSADFRRSNTSSCGSTSPQATPPHMLTVSSAPHSPSQQQPSSVRSSACGPNWGLLRLIGKNTCVSGGGASAVNKPRGATVSPISSGGSSPSPSLSGATGTASLDETVCSLVHRIQETILYDNEVDHLEQDRAYLQHRLSELHDFRNKHHSSSPAPAGDGAPAAEGAPAGGDAAAGEHAGANASLIQTEVLLAAVDARLLAHTVQPDSAVVQAWPSSGGTNTLADTGNLSGRYGVHSSQQSSGVALGLTSVTGACAGRLCGAPFARRVAANQLVDSGDLYHDGRTRRSGLRWLPVCFVGA